MYQMKKYTHTESGKNKAMKKALDLLEKRLKF